MREQISPVNGIFLFSSTIIGAGILALPAAASRSGFLPLLLVLVLVAAFSILSALYISEAVLCTEDSHHLPSLAKRYLGNWGMAAMILGTAIYIYGALIGYLSAGGQLISWLTRGAIPVRLGTVVYFLTATVIIHFGVKAVSYVGTYMFYAMIVLLGAVIAIVLPDVRVPLLGEAHWTSAPEAFGVVLFAYVGHSIIPSIANSLGKRRDILKVAVIGIAIPLFLYCIWSVVVVGTVPAASSDGPSLEGARAAGQPVTIPLGAIVGGTVVVLGNAFAVFSTMTSFIGFGLSLKDEYVNVARTSRQNLPDLASTLLVVLPALIVALFNPRAFVKTLDVAGAFGGGLFVGILPALMVIRIRRAGLQKGCAKRRGLTIPCLVLGFYGFGILYTVLQLFF